LEDFAQVLPYDETPENIIEQNDFTEQVVKIINTLPQKQRDAVFYSVIYNYSENEIAVIADIPVGSVKSAKHYGLEKVKKAMIENNLVNRKADNMNKLNKQEAYALLYQYAKGHISAEDKTAVEEYIKIDEEAANIAEALRELHGKLTYAKDDETTHYNIYIGLNDGGSVTYSNVSCHIENYQQLNECLESNNGYIPENETWFVSGFGGGYDLIKEYDNEGNKIEFEINKNSDNIHYRKNVTKMKKIYYPVHWQHTFYYHIKNSSHIKKSEKAPNLYEAKCLNHMGNNAKSALYLAIPENATNIRMIRGNGVLECGKYKFIYADRYVTADEGICAECTFNM